MVIADFLTSCMNGMIAWSSFDHDFMPEAFVGNSMEWTTCNYFAQLITSQTHNSCQFFQFFHQIVTTCYGISQYAVVCHYAIRRFWQYFFFRGKLVCENSFFLHLFLHICCVENKSLPQNCVSFLGAQNACERGTLAKIKTVNRTCPFLLRKP